MSSERREAVITGMGVVCAIGNDSREFATALREGRCGVAEPRGVDMSGYTTRLAAELNCPAPERYLDNPRSRLLQRDWLMLRRAAREALCDSGLALDTVDPFQVGVGLGSLLAGTRIGESFQRAWLSGATDRIPPRLLHFQPLGSPVDGLCAWLKIQGPRAMISVACASGTNAIGYGMEMIRAGQAEVMLVGGVDPLVQFCFAGFNSIHALASQPSSPFASQEGITIGEGAAILVLENARFARERGARVLAHAMGYGLSADAYHPVAPDPSGEGMARAMSGALKDAGLQPQDINYINAHGTGTLANDTGETRAIKRVFREQAREIPVSSTKSMIGHTMGAAGAIEVVASVAAIQGQFVPPTANFDAPKQGCDLDYVPNQSRPHAVERVLSNSFGFGGINASVVVGRGRGESAPDTADPVAPSPVLVTGLGPLSCIGVGREGFRQGLLAGEAGYGPTELFDTRRYSCQAVGEIKDLHRYSLVDPSHLSKMDSLSHYSVAAASLALEDSRLSITRRNAHRVGVMFATSGGPMTTVSSFNQDLILSGPTAVNPNLFPNTVFNAAAGHVCQEFGIKGFSSTIAGGDAAFGVALDYANHLLRRGALDVCLLVCADEICELLLAALDHLRLLSPGNACRPFDATGDGLIPSAAAAALVLERRDHAVGRGATSYGTLRSTAVTGGTCRQAERGLSAQGWGQAMKMALERAHLGPEDKIDYVAAAGCGAAQPDRAETEAIKQALGDWAYRVPVSAVRSLVGYGGAAGPALGVVAGLLGMQEGWVPPTFGLENPDPQCDLDYVPGATREHRVNCFLSSAFSWSGAYCGMVFAHPGMDAPAG